VPAWIRSALAALMVVAAHEWSAAQDESRIQVILSGAKPFRDDLKAIIGMAPGNLKKQANNVDETLESFQQGLDPELPIGLDLIFGEKLIYQPVMPIKTFEGKVGFLANLKDFGWKIAGPDAGGLYTITEPPPAPPRGVKKAQPKAAAPAEPYYMRHIHQHAVISPRKADLPVNLANPGPGLKMLLGPHDLVARIEGDDKTLQKRRNTFAEFRKQIEAAIKFKRGESEAEFELRKLGVAQNFNEAERFLIESKLLEIGWTTDMAKKDGRGVLRLEALPKTSLEDSVHLLVKDPSYFANVTLHDKPVLALKVNFAIDDMRSQHAKELYAALRPVMKLKIDERPALSEDGKKAAKETFNKFLDMLEAARALKVLDVFVDLHAAETKHTLVCGIRCVNGDDAIPLIEAFPKIREGWEIKTAIEEHGGVKIHSIGVAEHRKEEFESLFAGPRVFYIGTSDKAVWGAAGVNALAELKAAIDQSQQPAPEKADPVFLSIKANFGPLVDLIHVLREKEPKKPAEDKEAQEAAEQLEKTLAKINKFAKDSFGLCEVALEGVMRREGDAVTGEMSVHECVLQFIGSVAANWAAENLE